MQQWWFGSVPDSTFWTVSCRCSFPIKYVKYDSMVNIYIAIEIERAQESSCFLIKQENTNAIFIRWKTRLFLISSKTHWRRSQKRVESTNQWCAHKHTPNVILNCSCNPKMLVCIFLFFFLCMYACMFLWNMYMFYIYWKHYALAIHCNNGHANKAHIELSARERECERVWESACERQRASGKTGKITPVISKWRLIINPTLKITLISFLDIQPIIVFKRLLPSNRPRLLTKLSVCLFLTQIGPESRLSYS